MKTRIVILSVVFFSHILIAQDKTTISVFPFQNKSDKQYEWLSYGLSYMINESMNASELLEGVPQDQIYKAVSDPGINFTSVLDGKPNLVFAKYQSNWNTNFFTIGNFSVSADTLLINARVCNLYKKNCGSPITVEGSFRDFKDFYFLMGRLTEALYNELISYDVGITRVAVEKSRDKTRQLSADFEGYKGYVKGWMALRYYDDGVSSANMNRYDDAIHFFESAQTFDETNLLGVPSSLSKVYLMRANQFSEKTQWDEALSDYKVAIQLTPKNGEIYYDLGNMYKNRNDYDNAVKNYLKSLEVDPNRFEACVNMGYAYIEQGKYSDAVSAYEKALTINDSNASTHYFAGVAYDNNGDALNAIKHYRRSIELDNSQAGAHLNLGILLKQQKDLIGAKKEYELAIQHDPNSSTAHRNLGILLMNDKKESAQAVFHLQKCLDLDPDQAEAAILKKNIGILKKRSGKKNK